MVGEPYAYLPQCLAHSRHTLNIVKLNQSVLITQWSSCWGLWEMNAFSHAFMFWSYPPEQICIKIFCKFRKDI